MEEQPNNGEEQSIKDIGKSVIGAIGDGVVALKNKLARSKGRKRYDRSFLGATQAAVLLQIFAAALVVMGFFCYGFFELIAKAPSPFGHEITFKGWVYSFCTGLALGTLLSAFAEVIKLLIRIVKGIEGKEAEEHESKKGVA